MKTPAVKKHQQAKTSSEETSKKPAKEIKWSLIFWNLSILKP
jgi:hypothetical protein